MASLGAADVAYRARSLRGTARRPRAIGQRTRSAPRERGEPDAVRADRGLAGQRHELHLDLLPRPLGQQADEDLAGQQPAPRGEPRVTTLHLDKANLLNLAQGTAHTRRGEVPEAHRVAAQIET